MTSAALRFRLIDHRVTMLREALEQDRVAAAETATLVADTQSTLTGLVGVARRSAAEILVETGDIERFTNAGFARFNGAAAMVAGSYTTSWELPEQGSGIWEWNAK